MTEQTPPPADKTISLVDSHHRPLRAELENEPNLAQWYWSPSRPDYSVDVSDFPVLMTTFAEAQKIAEQTGTRLHTIEELQGRPPAKGPGANL